MSIVTTNNKYYSDIADAIRSKNGATTTYRPSEMAAAISALVIADNGPFTQISYGEAVGSGTATLSVSDFNPISSTPKICMLAAKDALTSSANIVDSMFYKNINNSCRMFTLLSSGSTGNGSLSNAITISNDKIVMITNVFESRKTYYWVVIE